MKKINLIFYHPDDDFAGGDLQPPPSRYPAESEAEKPSLSNLHSTLEKEIASDNSQPTGNVQTEGHIAPQPTLINGSNQQRDPTAEATFAAVEDESSQRSVDPTERTTRLLLAALRVWELKQGIYDD